jgi:hypothetical protein
MTNNEPHDDPDDNAPVSDEELEAAIRTDALIESLRHDDVAGMIVSSDNDHLLDMLYNWKESSDPDNDDND